MKIGEKAAKLITCLRVSAARFPSVRAIAGTGFHRLILPALLVIATGCLVDGVTSGRNPEKTSQLTIEGTVRNATGAPWTGPGQQLIARLRAPANCSPPLLDEGWVAFPLSSTGAFSGTLYAYDDAATAPRCLELRAEDNLVNVKDTVIASVLTGPASNPPVKRVDLSVPAP